MRVRPKEYDRMEQCIQDGLEWGWLHAHKHFDAPDRDVIINRMLRDIMSEICEEFEFKPYDNT